MGGDGESGGPKWVHNHELKFDNVRRLLAVAKAGVEQAVHECESVLRKKQAELRRMRGGR